MGLPQEDSLLWGGEDEFQAQAQLDLLFLLSEL